MSEAHGEVVQQRLRQGGKLSETRGQKSDKRGETEGKVNQVQVVAEKMETGRWTENANYFRSGIRMTRTKRGFRSIKAYLIFFWRDTAVCHQHIT